MIDSSEVDTMKQRAILSFSCLLKHFLVVYLGAGIGVIIISFFVVLPAIALYYAAMQHPVLHNLVMRDAINSMLEVLPNVWSWLREVVVEVAFSLVRLIIIVAVGYPFYFWLAKRRGGFLIGKGVQGNSVMEEPNEIAGNEKKSSG